jgi:rubrerythrin
MSTNSAKQIIELMIKSELDFSKLYLKYSRVFPNADFWLGLAQEENLHAEWLKALIESRDVDEIDTKITPPAFIMAMNLSVEEEIKSANNTSLIQALTKTMHLENTFLEKNYLELFEGHAESLKKVVGKLVEESRIHREKIKTELEKYEL